jgi:hypothetical protein
LIGSQFQETAPRKHAIRRDGMFFFVDLTLVELIKWFSRRFGDNQQKNRRMAAFFITFRCPCNGQKYKIGHNWLKSMDRGASSRNFLNVGESHYCFFAAFELSKGAATF